MDPRELLRTGLRTGQEALRRAVPGGMEGAESIALPRASGHAEAPVALPEEAALIARAQAGDQEAFGVLVRLHQRNVYALALRMLRDPDDAAEATQEAFLAAWQGLRSFRSEARLATWLYRITYNHCLKAQEQVRRERAARSEMAATTAQEAGPARQLSAQHARDAEGEVRQTVREEIARLPDKYQAVLILRHLQDLSYEEMAQVLRVPIGTVKTHLFRARALLKERLEELGRARDEGLARAGELRADLETGVRAWVDRAWEPSRRGGAQ